MNPRLLLGRLIDLERRVRYIYLTLGERAAFPAEVRFFWNSMAEDERHHLAILERSAELLDLVELPPEVSEDVLADVEAKVAAAEAVIQRSDLQADEGLHQALVIESSELNRLDEAWFQGFGPAVGALLQAMIPEEELHLRRLVEAVQVFSQDKALHDQATAVWVRYQQRQPDSASV